MSDKKIFFALLPETPTANAISKQVKHIKDVSPYTLLQWVKKENIHLTLCFIGRTEEKVIADLISYVKTVPFIPFEFQLDCSGVFEKAGALWIGPESTNTALLELSIKITDMVRSRNISISYNSFVPHVTIARKFKDKHMHLSFQPIYWCVKNFYLMESVSTPHGVQYNVLHKF